MCGKLATFWQINLIAANLRFVIWINKLIVGQSSSNMYLVSSWGHFGQLLLLTTYLTYDMLLYIMVILTFCSWLLFFPPNWYNFLEETLIILKMLHWLTSNIRNLNRSKFTNIENSVWNSFTSLAWKKGASIPKTGVLLNENLKFTKIDLSHYLSLLVHCFLIKKYWN